MLKLNRIDVQRGVRATGFAAALGLGIAGVLAIAVPLGPLVGPTIYTMFVCAAWITYAPDGKHRLTAALAGLFLLSYMAMSTAAAAFPGDPYFATLITVAGQIIVTMVLTAMRAVRL